MRSKTGGWKRGWRGRKIKPTHEIYSKALRVDREVTHFSSLAVWATHRCSVALERKILALCSEFFDKRNYFFRLWWPAGTDAVSGKRLYWVESRLVFRADSVSLACFGWCQCKSRLAELMHLLNRHRVSHGSWNEPPYLKARCIRHMSLNGNSLWGGRMDSWHDWELYVFRETQMRTRFVRPDSANCLLSDRWELT